MKPATKDSWTTRPLPRQRARLAANWRYSQDEFQRVLKGLIPEVMEDKWFIFFEAGWLYFHRSWTGNCIFQAQFRETDAGWAVTQFLVNRDPDQYQSDSDDYDRQLLRFLIDSLLLGKPAEFPQTNEDQGKVKSALRRWHQVGREKPGSQSKIN